MTAKDLGKILVNDSRTNEFKQDLPGYERVLHIAHIEWHGIRSATGTFPGETLLIAHDSPLGDHNIEKAIEWIQERGFTKIVFQGFSHNADKLLLRIRMEFLSSVKCYAIAHVTTTQFRNFFEIEMQSLLMRRIQMGVLERVGSVKPHFSKTFESYWPETILNFAPNIDPVLHVDPDDGVTLFAPLSTEFRKNLYTNIFAGLQCSKVSLVKSSVYPVGLADICDVSRLKLVGFLRGMDLFEEMGRSTAVLIGTLAECQPMTQLEAFAMGTPALTGDLGIDDFKDDPLIELCTTRNADNPYLLSQDIQRIVEARKSAPLEMKGMIEDHLKRRLELADMRMKDFLGL